MIVPPLAMIAGPVAQAARQALARRKRLLRATTLAGPLMAAALIAAPGQAAPPSTRDPVLIQSDVLTYDSNLNTVTAEGKVVIDQGGRTVKADRVTYNQATGRVNATGNVTIIDPSRDTVFADFVELDDNLANGVAETVKLLMANDARLAANKALRKDGLLTELFKAVYSPCKPCADDPDRPLPWQVKALHVVHDGTKRDIIYDDATFEVAGIPIAYIPHFSHADPTVKRRSGFLTPSFGNQSDIGFRAELPYYWAITDSRDLTITPMITTRGGIVMQGQYRERLTDGAYGFDVSGVYTDKPGVVQGLERGKTFRGHIFGTGRFNLSDDFRIGFDLRRASDDTYLRRYKLGNQNTLTSRVFAERLTFRSMASADFLAFQGLRATDIQSQIPIVMPLINWDLSTAPDKMGNQFQFNANALVLERSQGGNTRRLSASARWNLPFYDGLGSVYRVSASVRGDVYSLLGYPDPRRPGRKLANKTVTRLLPQASIEWRFPMVNTTTGDWRQSLEPIASLITSTTGGNPASLPNEDSGAFEFDDTNLFSRSRFPGYDRWETGTRLNAGVKWSAANLTGQSVSALFGQSYRLNRETAFAVGSGLEGRRSDYVGRLVLTPVPWLDIYQRFRLDRDTLNFRRNEIGMALGTGDYKAAVSYVRLARDPADPTLPSREEFFTDISAKIAPEWLATASVRQDLGGNSRTISSGAGLYYVNECITLGLTYERSNYTDREIRPSTSINFVIKLATLG